MRNFALIVISFSCLIYTRNLFAQGKTNYTIEFHPIFGSLDLKPNDTFYKINNQDSIQITTLKLYISNIQFMENNIVVWKEENSGHLIDASDEKSLSVELNVSTSIKFSQISFTIGIDSITNVSGVMGGDLDPTKGMYWTWQSGYINFKLEGKSNVCKTRNSEFEFHIGGYQSPFNTLQSALLNIICNPKIEIDIDCKKLFESIELAKQNHIMSPCNEAVFLSKKIVRIFSIR
ncbi:MAG: hypothetical protein HYZ42_04825 [Bacteroidetes bacterium]|nr:hypothetical protein [Bacteroidota bacterium]